ncbi:MAG: restriction endonuclease subunit S [Deltaproteobacteria bacterium]|nr:restriction endonuclease subunit S [Deltaproteobacteria bacterium]
MNDGLKDKHRRAIIDILAAHPGVERAVLFGSRAMGTFTAASDVDIALFGDSLTLDDQARLARKIDELTIPQRVDLLRYKTIKDKNLRAHIRRHGVEWFSRAKAGKTQSGGGEGASGGGSEWKQCVLGNVIELKRGYDLPKRVRRPGPYPVISSSGPSGTHIEYKATSPGVVTGRYGTIGEVFFIESDYWPLNTALYVRDFKGNDKRYVYYLLKSINYRTYSDKSAVPRINRNHLHQEQVRIPTIPIQQRIAHILGTLDDKIELNRRMNRTLEKMAAAIFKSWFIDFDPVHAKAEGQDTLSACGHAQAGGLPKEIADLFPDSFEDSEIGLIPKGWCVKYLPEVIEVNPRRSLPRGTVAPYVPMKEMPTRLSRPTGWWRRKFNSGSKFRNGDVLLARITPCLENGKTAFVDFLDGNEIGWGSTEYIVLRSNPPLPPEFTYCLARSERLREHAIANMTGTSGRQRAPASCFDRFLVTVPSEGVASAFGKFVQTVFRKTRANDIQSMTLKKIRDTLLPKLLSGELKVPDVEATIGEVVR